MTTITTTRQPVARECPAGCDLTRLYGDLDGAADAHARLLGIEDATLAQLADLVDAINAAAFCHYGADRDPLWPVYPPVVRRFARQHLLEAFHDPAGVDGYLVTVLELASAAARDELLDTHDLEQLRELIGETPVDAAGEASAIRHLRASLEAHRERWEAGDERAAKVFVHLVHGVPKIALRLLYGRWGSSDVAEWAEELFEQLTGVQTFALWDEHTPGRPADVDRALTILDEVAKQLDALDEVARQRDAEAMRDASATPPEAA